MQIKSHPMDFRIGTRVLMLRGRNKDGATEKRCIFRVTHSLEHFDDALAELCSMARPGERVYGSAGARSMQNAIREFKRRQLDADYDEDPERFYRGLDARWVSALMHPTCQEVKFWMFDCDTAEHRGFAMEAIPKGAWLYEYRTKNGQHIIVRPFDRSKTTSGALAILHENPQMLWAWKE